MTKKQGYVSPYHMGFLAGVIDVANYASSIMGKTNNDIETAFYVTAFQCGMEQFLLWPFEEDKLPASEFVKKRIKFLSASEDILKQYMNVGMAFDEYMPDDYRSEASDNKYASIHRLEMYIQDLLVAMHSKSSLLTVSSKPDLAEIETCMPIELFVPISNLLSTINHQNVPLPVPSGVFLREDIERYQQILEGTLFTDYANAQKLLDHEDVPISKALSEITQSGKRLFSANSAILGIRTTAIGLLSVTPKIIEYVFGALPGKLAENVCNLGFGLLEQQRNVVVYGNEHLILRMASRNLESIKGDKEMQNMLLTKIQELRDKTES